MSDVKRLESAIQKAMVGGVAEIRSAYADLLNKHRDDPEWYSLPGKYDKRLARRYARIIAPRVAELLEASDE